ncbi:MAG: ferredoxin-type protein NapF [Cohaesibacter sp.]|nr:ferredoxin-type protein NapF [Cohaesibacter sp.]MCV6600017.1 ferredoxin-type protein NapF [Cohaesibacter sp.]
MDRRTFLSGGQKGNSPIRPPYTHMDERTFFDACIGCEDCVAACPTNLLQSGYMGRPEVDFSNAYCTFCGQCSQACRHDVLIAPKQEEAEACEKAWSLKAQVTSLCLESKAVTCRACESACGYDAMRFRPQLGGKSLLLIDAERCTGCGECLSSCPVQALVITSFDTALSSSSNHLQTDPAQKEYPL